MNNEKWRWARKYDKCTNCGTIKIKYIGNGFCKRCINKQYYEKNKESILKKRSIYYLKNIDKIKKYEKKRRQNPERIKRMKEYNKIYRDKETTKIKRKLYLERYFSIEKNRLRKNIIALISSKKKSNKKRIRLYINEKRKNPKHQINHAISSAILHSLKQKKMGRHWEDLVGYTIKDIMNCLESKFDEKMNWENYGSYWWIDHKKPVSKFNFNSYEEFKECWALDNLQPMEKISNIKKGDTY